MSRKLTPAELERAAGINRTVPAAPTQRDVVELTRKRLGRLWGRKHAGVRKW